MFRTLRLAAMAALTAFSATALADTVNLPLTDDAHISDDVGIWSFADTNFGSAPDLFVHNYGPRRTLVRFYAASITGQAVSGARLSLHLNNIKASGPITLFAVTSSWNEASVTWNLQPPVEATSLAAMDLTTADVDTVIVIDVTDAVQRWADGSLADAGFLITTTEPIRAFFDSKEKSGGIPATLEVDTGPIPDTGEATTLDFNDRDNCTIGEPGLYILDRSWNFGPPEPNGACHDTGPLGRGGIFVTASDVTIDLRGFEIDLQRPSGSDLGDATIHIADRHVRIRNGTVAGNSAIYGDESSFVELTNVHMVGDIQAGSGLVLNSTLTSDYSRGGMRFDDQGGAYHLSVVVRDSILTCTYPSVFCLDVSGHPYIEIANNQVNSTAGIRTYGGEGIIKDNVILLNMSQETDAGIWAYLNGKSITGNVIINGTDIGKGMTLTGHVGIVDNNLIRGTYTGLLFVAGAGNYMGNNRVSAVTPFFGHETQVDWGGNIAF
jgi:hypothetical protein